MRTIIRLALTPLLLLMYWLAAFIPRRKNLWIFGSYNNAFNDNAKYLYIEVVDRNPGIEAIWITGDSVVRNHIRAAGGKALSRWSLKGLWACLRGKYWFINAYATDINYYCCNNAVIINLWHGIPLKKIEFDIENGPLAKQFQRPNWMEKHLLWPWIYRRPNYVLSPSTRISDEIFTSAFRVMPNQFLNLGFPRTDCFFKPYEECLRICQRWDLPITFDLMKKIGNYKRCLIYMPTWRDANPNFIARSGWDFQILNEELKKHDILLILKLHVNTPKDNLFRATNLSNIHLMQSNEDVYNILPLTSGLITDYSSVIFDYLLLDKPIYFYAFDWEEYMLDSRGFYHEYKSCAPGRFIENPLNITDPMIEKDVDTYADARRELLQRFYDNVDQFASTRIIQMISDL